MLLEIACFNTESCTIAESAGVRRIELCAGYNVGGVTPSQETITEARKLFSGNLFVMIRPVAGEFVYTAEEYREMQATVSFCKTQHCNGFVFGILDDQNTVDKERCKTLVDLASPLPCTFHRAFDRCPDPEKALEDIIACGFTRILTSGRKNTALEGASLIRDLRETAGNRITLMPGGGIRSSNVMDVVQLSGAGEFHSAAITGNTEIADKNEILNLKDLLNCP